MKRPTQKDVAQRAGVSRSTVSYVLNDQAELKIPISDETRQRVMDAVTELGYEPDARAQSLRSGTSKTVGVIIPVVYNPFFWQTFAGISIALQEAGYGLYMSNPPVHPQQGDDDSIRTLIRQRVDGLILLAGVKYLLPGMTDYLREVGRPIVEITAGKAEFDHVIHGYSAGTRKLLAHLLELGHRRIGLVYAVAQVEQGFDRLHTFHQVLQDAGLPNSDAYVVRCGDSLEDAYRAAYSLLNRSDRPTALLVINDMLATAVMRAAADLGLAIPGHLSVAGFDDIPFSNYMIPRLTTVSGRSEESGRDAVRLLLNRFAKPDLPQQVTTVAVELIVRESTGPVPIP